MKIRKIKTDEFPFLEEMLYQALFVPEGEKPFAREITKKPELARYISCFGREGDVCFVAEQNGTLCGAAWSRFYRKNKDAFDCIGDNTPELSIALFKEYRGKGTGTKLLSALLAGLEDAGVTQVMLSAKKQNRAVGLYKKFGFKAVREDEDTYIMVKKLCGVKLT